MEIVRNFLFCNQLYTDREPSTPAVIDLDSITVITVMNVVRVELTENRSILIDYDPESFFTDFAELLEENEKSCCY